MTFAANMMINILHITISSVMQATREDTEGFLTEGLQPNKECMGSLIKVTGCHHRPTMISSPPLLPTWAGMVSNRTQLRDVMELLAV